MLVSTFAELAVGLTKLSACAARAVNQRIDSEGIQLCPGSAEIWCQVIGARRNLSETWWVEKKGPEQNSA